MSIIEKALEKLAKPESSAPSSGPSSAGLESGSGFGLALGGSLAPDAAIDSSSTSGEARSAVARSSRPYTLDFDKLRGAGILTEGTDDRRLLEQFRLLKHTLLRRSFEHHAESDRLQNVVMVTSAVEGEGKTFTSLNLAMAVAREVNYSVLLIDGDMIRRGLSRLCGTDEQPGLVDYLRSTESHLSEFLLKTNVGSLTLLPAGTVTDNISELAGSVRMRTLMQELASRYADRLIVIDTPPLLRDSSAVVFAGLAAQIALVVAAEETPQQAVRDALETLPAPSTVGIILNKCNRHFRSEYDYGYY